MITDAEINRVLVKVCKLTRLIEQTDIVIDGLLMPIVTEVAATEDVEQSMALVNKLPTGFHRSELRTLANVLQAKNETQ